MGDEIQHHHDKQSLVERGCKHHHDEIRNKLFLLKERNRKEKNRNGNALTDEAQRVVEKAEAEEDIDAQPPRGRIARNENTCQAHDQHGGHSHENAHVPRNEGDKIIEQAVPPLNPVLVLGREQEPRPSLSHGEEIFLVHLVVDADALSPQGSKQRQRRACRTQENQISRTDGGGVPLPLTEQNAEHKHNQQQNQKRYQKQIPLFPRAAAAARLTEWRRRRKPYSSSSLWLTKPRKTVRNRIFRSNRNDQFSI